MRKAALVVGVTKYRDRAISPLQYAAKDARAVAECLRTTCGFDDVRLLADGSEQGEPDIDGVLDATEDFCQELAPDDLFLLYFAGHALEHGGEPYLLTQESRLRAPKMKSVHLNELVDLLAPMEASRRVIVLDACRNSPYRTRGEHGNPMGSATAETLERFASRDVGAVPKKAKGKRPSGPAERVTAILTACAPEERAYEWDRQEHGVFTHFLLEALREKAWRDGVLDCGRIASHVKDGVTRWCRNRPEADLQQTPTYRVDSEKPVVLARRTPVQVAPAVESEPDDELVASVRSRRALLQWGSDGARRSLFVTRRDEVVLGRGTESEFVLRLLPFLPKSDDPERWEQQRDIGREQLRLLVSEEGVVVTPVSSSATTFVATRGAARRLSAERELPLVRPARLLIGPGSDVAGVRIELVLRAIRGGSGNVAGVVLERRRNAESHRYLIARERVDLARAWGELDGLPAGIAIEPTEAGLALRGGAGTSWPIDGAEFRTAAVEDFMTA